MSKTKKTEFGDFQTPLELTNEIAWFLKADGICPEVILEPTCGLGNFLISSVATFSNHIKYFVFDINPEYIQKIKNELSLKNNLNFEISRQNFFEMNWKLLFKELPERTLVLGNPPWVTNAALGILGSNNLPEKNNFQKHKGFAAKTGKANFDISEWMLIKLLESMENKKAYLAMLCKTATARKVLKHCWENNFHIYNSSIHLIDAKKHFNVSVDACLLYTHTGQKTKSKTSSVYSGLNFKEKISRLGKIGNELVADIDAYQKLNFLDGIEYYKWRSGVKHDAAKVMELNKENGTYVNGLKESYKLEDSFLYPLLKSSDIANDRLIPRKYVLLTQKNIVDNTDIIKPDAPKTWQNLLDHAEYLDRRGSVIYSKRPRFSIFGVGEYTFAKWKVAISGFYKNLHFVVIGSYEKKPIIVDDTCYFIPCNSEKEARFIATLLNSKVAKKFIHSLVFFDSKRPVNIDVLKRIDLKKISKTLGMEEDSKNYLADARYEFGSQRQMVFDKKGEYKVKKK
ncbi:SAM-dependent DNA methyltransferase [candidate division KSB1 bacterium]|nr:SAM-dependent DNA methyltransferase [candidate division KSB1 bacterium]